MQEAVAPGTVRVAAAQRSTAIDKVDGGWPALAAEFVGTAVLVFFGVGTAVFSDVNAGVVGIAIAFGFVLVALVYAIGSISGCHVNPAVTIGMVLARRMNAIAGAMYVVVQFAGGIIGALLVYWVSHTIRARSGGPFSRKSLGSNGYGGNSDLFISAGGAFLVEVILTALLVLVVLSVTSGPGVKGLEGVAIGLSLVAIHLVGIPLTGTSVNPARSLGPAIFATNNALSQVWLFIIAPPVGAILAAGIHMLIRRRSSESPAADSTASESAAAESTV